MLRLRRLIWIIILIFLCVISVNAQSQRPTPSGREKGKPQQQEIKTKQQQPASDQRGTEQAPLVVKTVNPPKTEAETNQDRQDRAKKASHDGWFLVFTGLLAAFALIQVGVLIWQGCSMKGTLQLTREAAAVAKESADAAKESADAIQSAERAYLFVEVRLNSDNPNENRIIIGDNHIEIIATNLGRTPAVILNIQKFCQEHPDRTAIDNLVKDIDRVASNKPTAITPGTRVIGGGDSGRIFNAIFPVNNEQFRDIGIETAILACLGVIQYKIVFGEIHKTVFCWEYEPRFGFGPDENPKHNYYT
jgi:hypothetical protein